MGASYIPEIIATTIFWILVLAEMAWAIFCFANFNREYDNDLRRGGRLETNVSLALVGFLSSGMPVLQVGTWVFYSKTWAFVAVVAVLIFWLMETAFAVADTKRRRG